MKIKNKRMSNGVKKTIFLASLLLMSPAFVFGATVEELQAQINALLAQIQQLQQQLNQQQNPIPTQWCYTFNNNLKFGDQGDDVGALHVALEKEGISIGGPADINKEKVNKYFGENTASAVVNFQQKYKDEILTPAGLQYGTGFVGPRTREKLNKLYGCGQSAATSAVAVVSPNGGESWQKGATYNILWGAQNANATVEIKLLNSYGFAVSNIASGVANTGIYSWTIPTSLPDGDYKMFVSIGSLRDESNAVFRISGTTTDGTVSSIKITRPTRGEGYRYDATTQIVGVSLNWEYVCSGTNRFTVSLYKGGVFVKTAGDVGPITCSVGQPKSYVATGFTLSSVLPGDDYTVRVSSGGVHGESDMFSILSATSQAPINIRIYSPVPPSGPVDTKILLSISNDSLATEYTILYTGPVSGSRIVPIMRTPIYGGGYSTNLGYLEFTVPSDFPAGTYTIKAKNNVTNVVSGNSEIFTVTSAATASTPVTLTSISPPSGPVGTSVRLDGCGSDSASGFTLIYAGPKSGSVVIPVETIPGAGGCGYMTFNVPSDFPAGAYELKVKNNQTGVMSTNSMTFTVTVTVTTTPSITVISPNGGEAWEVGKNITITWTSSGISSDKFMVKVQNIAFSEKPTIADIGTGASSPFSLTIFSPGQYKIEVCDGYYAVGSFVCDTSDAPFSIVAATATTPVTLSNIIPSSGPVGTNVNLYGCGGSSASGFTLIYTGPKSGTASIPVETFDAASGCGYMTLTVPSDFPAGAYTLSVKNNQTGVVSTNSMTFTVTAASTTTPAPTVTLTANPPTITSGQSSNLTWQSTNATSCTFTGQTRAAGETVSTGTLTSSQTYTVTCTGAGGSTTQSVTVTVTPTASTATPVTLSNIIPSSGPVGTNVNLYGCGGSSASGYTLIYTGPVSGNTILPITLTSGDCGYMNFAVPAGFPVGTYTLTVKNNSTGAASTNSMLFTVTGGNVYLNNQYTANILSVLESMKDILNKLSESLR